MDTVFRPFPIFFLGCLVALLEPRQSLQRVEDGTTTKLHGTVSMMSDVAEGIEGAKLTFSGSDGSVLDTTTNTKGEYEVLLKPGLQYRVTVVSGPTCILHRPAFLAKSREPLWFDFVVPSEIKYVDWSIRGKQRAGTKLVRPTLKVPYCDEETISFGNPPRDLVISYGMFDSNKDVDTYYSLPISKFPGKQVQATISYEAYTIRAERIEFHRKSDELAAIGKVSITDGGSSQVRVVSCVKLRLRGETRPEECESPLRESTQP